MQTSFIVYQAVFPMKATYPNLGPTYDIKSRKYVTKVKEALAAEAFRMYRTADLQNDF